jgi:hypothetical protein
MHAWTQQLCTASADAHPQLAAAQYTRAATARVRQQAAANRGSNAERSGAVQAAAAPLLLLARMLQGVPATVELDSYTSNGHTSNSGISNNSSSSGSVSSDSASISGSMLSTEQRHSITAVAVTELLVQSRALREQCTQTFPHNSNNIQPTQQQADCIQEEHSESSGDTAVHASVQHEGTISSESSDSSHRMTAQQARQVLEQSQQLRAACAQDGLFGLVCAQ